MVTSRGGSSHWSARRVQAPRAHPRIAARARQRRWSVVAPWLAAVGTAAVLGLLAWLLLASGYLAVHHITVKGTSRLSPAQVAAASGADGRAMLTLDEAAIRRRVLALPAVADVEVHRSWPTTLRLTVRERRPVAALPTAGGVRLVDGTGVAFATVAKAPPGVVPLHLDAPVSGAGAGAARAAVKVLGSLPADLRRQVVAVSASSASAVTLQLSGGRTVVWGGPDQTARKAAVLRVLLRQHAHRYDVSSPDVAVTS